MAGRGVWGFTRLDYVVSEVTRLVCMEIVAVVAVPSARAPGDTTVQGVRHEPDLPGCAEFLVERGQGPPRGRSPQAPLPFGILDGLP
jgi:hypothetical protein